MSPSASLAGNWELDAESGLVNSGYNVARIPGTTGTQVSLSDAFQLQPQPYIRLKAFYQFNDEHGLGVLYAPLRFQAEGEAPFPIAFEDKTFPARTSLTAWYRFNSYRLTYRYRFWNNSRWQGHLGFTAKIRDAEISLEGNGVKAQKTNVGFVPLLYLRLSWKVVEAWSLLLEADALAAPQGRAEDLLVAVQYQADDHWRLRLGYRGVEGGADNDVVYNFAAIHYAVLGVTACY
ncbi:hypothetical protein JW933_04390 [candidate division FCPU426 bacterium]|nr:hypothetical protein [candidate division FCPU426 bacterium]